MSNFHIFRNICRIINPLEELKLRLNAYRDNFLDLYANTLYKLSPFWSLPPPGAQRNQDDWFVASFDKMDSITSPDLSFFTSCKTEIV